MEYGANRTRVRDLRGQLRDLFRQVGLLQAAVEAKWLDFDVSGSSYLLDGGSMPIHQAFLDELPTLMQELKEALLEERRLQDKLKSMGLEGLIE